LLCISATMMIIADTPKIVNTFFEIS